MLTSPSGTEVLLFPSVNSQAFGDDFGTTCAPQPNFVLDDSAELPVLDFLFDANMSPDAGPFTPFEPLSVLNDENQKGVWTLFVTDAFLEDFGTLSCWCLEISRKAVVVPTLSGWGLIALAGGTGLFGILFALRRQKRRLA